MKDFEGRVAVITGAASGIGRGLAATAAKEGMKLVLADVDEAGLKNVATALAGQGAQVQAVPTDVSDPAQVEALADAAQQAFGGIHLVCNNAGVLVGGTSWERSAADWEWQVGVNVFGVVHGIRVFVPRLLAQGEPAHIVNTASIGGLTVGPFLAPYIMTKHAVVALSECVYLELQTTGAPVGLSVLCPGGVRTGIAHSERIRPERHRIRPEHHRIRPERHGGAAEPAGGAAQAFQEGLEAGIDKGMEPEECARQVFEAVRENRFWILTHPEFEPQVEQRLRGILDRTNPVLSLPSDSDD